MVTGKVLSQNLGRSELCPQPSQTAAIAGKVQEPRNVLENRAVGSKTVEWTEKLPTVRGLFSLVTL